MIVSIAKPGTGERSIKIQCIALAHQESERLAH